MFNFDFKKRITAAESLQHPYFKEYELYPPILNDKPPAQTPTQINNSRRTASSRSFTTFPTANSTLKNKVV